MIARAGIPVVAVLDVVLPALLRTEHLPTALLQDMLHVTPSLAGSLALPPLELLCVLPLLFLDTLSVLPRAAMTKGERSRQPYYSIMRKGGVAYVQPRGGFACVGSMAALALLDRVIEQREGRQDRQRHGCDDSRRSKGADEVNCQATGGQQPDRGAE